MGKMNCQISLVACSLLLSYVVTAAEAPDVVLDGFSVGKVKLMCRERRGWKVDFR